MAKRNLREPHAPRLAESYRSISYSCRGLDRIDSHFSSLRPTSSYPCGASMSNRMAIDLPSEAGRDIPAFSRTTNSDKRAFTDRPRAHCGRGLPFVFHKRMQIAMSEKQTRMQHPSSKAHESHQNLLAISQQPRFLAPPPTTLKPHFHIPFAQIIREAYKRSANSSFWIGLCVKV